MDSKGEIVIYQTQDGTTQLDVRLDGETVWITQEQMAQLFQRDRTAIGRHIANIFSEGELDRNVVCANFAHTTLHGAKLHRYMYMSDYMALLEDLIRVNKRPVLAGKGSRFLKEG